jgi:hypothetical protein
MHVYETWSNNHSFQVNSLCIRNFFGFGKNTVFLAGMEKAKDSADEKIAFQKTWLFQEGKGDNEWMNTFRGLRD